ncbi:dihydroneopterin aldolase [Selenomonas ruminantium]|uniref:7,8-dihydroneopterin aldolase n=1 Tax=Selenomonas ruminantium TaxID=971 RepID=A0A1H0UPE4_SELRU|nr:dihydroneopterin aldolase [Selenomonas ruminantium]SDP68069.1 dihydroneopterin aldolase [Selenomonas ruminantium]
MDKIKLTGLNFYGYHGVLPAERQMGQEFSVDVSMYLDLQEAGQSDKLEATVNYAEVYAVVKKVVEGQPRKLIESVGEEIAQNILRDFLPVQRVRVTVHKPHAPLPGVFMDASISVVRSRA